MWIWLSLFLVLALALRGFRRGFRISILHKTYCRFWEISNFYTVIRLWYTVLKILPSLINSSRLNWCYFFRIYLFLSDLLQNGTCPQGKGGGQGGGGEVRQWSTAFYLNFKLVQSVRTETAQLQLAEPTVFGKDSLLSSITYPWLPRPPQFRSQGPFSSSQEERGLWERDCYHQYTSRVPLASSLGVEMESTSRRNCDTTK